MKGQKGGMGEVKGMDGWIMSDHKRVGLHKAFSPSGLSAAPESNIHLAWCIPGLETLMWFVGDSRWQVHGSTLLTDSAGASGRVNNNTECLSPPSSLLLSNHTSYPPTLPSTQMQKHTHTDFLFINVLVPGDCQRNHSWCWHSAQKYQSCNLLFSTLFLSHSFCPSAFHASLTLPLTLSLYTSCLSYFITLSRTPTTLTRMPLDSSHILLWLSFTPSITPRSRFFTSFALLYILPPNTYSCIGYLMSSPPTPV